MRGSLPTRFWIEVALGSVSGALAAVTLAWPDWIERIFALEPDGGDGGAEWGLALFFAGLALAFIVLSRRTWSRHVRLSAQGTGN